MPYPVCLGTTRGAIGEVALATRSVVWVSLLDGRTAGETGFLIPTGVVGVKVIARTPGRRTAVLKNLALRHSKSLCLAFRRHGSSCLNGRPILIAVSRPNKNTYNERLTTTARVFFRDNCTAVFAN